MSKNKSILILNLDNETYASDKKRIKIKEIEGVIESIDNICVVIVTVNGKMIFPIKEVVDEIVLVKNNDE